MSALPYLSDDEILSIVRPLTQPAAIVRWFRLNGFPDVRKRPNGMPLVSRTYFDAATAGTAPKPEQPGRAPGGQPNVQAYLQRIAAGAAHKQPAKV
jgi:hypothetical protein